MYKLILILACLLWSLAASAQITSGPQVNNNSSGIGSLTIQGTNASYVQLPTSTANIIGSGVIGLAFNPNNTSPSITLSNGNLTATASGSAWISTISLGSGKTSGKWYYRLKISPSSADDVGAAFCLNTEPTNNLLGNDANGWLGFGLPAGAAGGVWHNAASIGALPPIAAAGDYIVAAYDEPNAKVYFTTMTAAGVLSTNWDNVNDNPSTNTGGFAVTLGMSLQPGASLLTSAAGSVTLDTTSTISDSTLTGFLPYGPH